MDVAHLLLDELGCHYLGDELPPLDGTFVREHLTRMARQSALRLARAAGVAGGARLLALLRELRDDRGHPLYKQIANQTLVGWSDEDASFAVFQALLDQIAAELAGLTPGTA